MAEYFKALGDPTRLKLIRMLISHPEHPLCVGALARKLGISQPAVSQHLRVLKSVGIVEPNRAGYHVHYAIRSETLLQFKNDLEELMNQAFEPCNHECQCPPAAEAE